MAGRPTEYTAILAERISALAAQGLSKRKIAEQEGMPHRETIDVWLSKHPEFSSQYARAVETRTEAYAEEVIEIADNPELPSDQKRVMIDARKWVACKLLPKVYGDKLDLTHRGTINLTPDELSEEQIMNRLAELRAKSAVA